MCDEARFLGEMRRQDEGAKKALSVKKQNK
jgi:hypothetical protein